MLLIVGMMVGYVASSVVSLLNYFATEEGVRSFMIWGLGHFGGVSMALMPAFSTVTGGPHGLPVAHQTTEYHPTGCAICREHGRSHPTAAQRAASPCRTAHRHDHSLLWPHCFHRTGRAPYRAPATWQRRPTSAHALHHSLWKRRSPALQPGLLATHRRGATCPSMPSHHSSVHPSSSTSSCTNGPTDEPVDSWSLSPLRNGRKP